MLTDANDSQNVSSRTRLVAYFVKAFALIGILALLSFWVPSMPAWGFAVVWALLSLIPATGLVYHAVINKTYGQAKFQEGSRLATFNNGRIVRLVIAFVLSAICVASLLVESPKWDAAMWTMVVLAVPLYLAMSALVGKFVSKEYRPLFRESRKALISAAVTAVLLCLASAVVLWFQPPANYTCAADAFLAAPRPFAASSSVILSEIGDISALVSGLTSYAMAKTAETSFGVYVVWQVGLNAAAFFAITGMLAVCSINSQELKRIFLRLESDDSQGKNRPLLKRYVAASIMLPLVLIAGFVFADTKAGEVVKTKEYTAAQEFIRNQVSLAVYLFDDKYYNPQAVEDLLSRAQQASNDLSAEVEEKLVPLINASYDARIANVDSYLDWYYSLFADWEQLASLITGNAEEFAKKQLESHIERGIDDTELNAELERCLKQAEDIKAKTLEELSRYEISTDYPEWLVTQKSAIDDRIKKTIEPSQRVADASMRLGLSAATGVVAGVIAKKVISKLIKKSVFKTVANRVGTLAAASATASAGGPVVVAVTLVASLAADIAILKADELMHRDEYKAEIVEGIEQQREEMLAAVRGQVEVIDTAESNEAGGVESDAGSVESAGEGQE